LSLPASVGIRCGDPGDDPAVDPQPRIRRQDDPEEVVLVELPLVDHVVEATADQRREGDDNDLRAEDAGIEPAPSSFPGDDPVGDRKSDCIGDAVPADLERSNRESDRVRGEIDHESECPMDGRSQRPSPNQMDRTAPTSRE
jgi:hypothetical protein